MYQYLKHNLDREGKTTRILCENLEREASLLFGGRQRISGKISPEMQMVRIYMYISVGSILWCLGTDL